VPVMGPLLRHPTRARCSGRPSTGQNLPP
jgi:hypothetical protein